ncbi:hypothetical protein Adt_14053 [Abeliophyllum distichum]|uniref:Uncharacterized protein n=1 Tax=Abeliophyllum distichum TaxID=126358 RepID=A0ABD1TYK9_9LAMI
MDHSDAIEIIHRGTSLYRHECCRDEAVFHLLKTLTGYWKDFFEQLDVMFDHQMSGKLLIDNLRKRRVINNKDYRVMERPEGYQHNHHRHQPHNASWERGHEQVLEVDSEGHIIEYVPRDLEEEEDLEEDEDPESNESTRENY